MQGQKNIFGTPPSRGKQENEFKVFLGKLQKKPV